MFKVEIDFAHRFRIQFCKSAGGCVPLHLDGVKLSFPHHLKSNSHLMFLDCNTPMAGPSAPELMLGRVLGVDIESEEQVQTTAVG